MNSESTVSVSSTAPAEGELQALLRRQQKAFRADMLPSHTVREDRLKRLAGLIETHSRQFAGSISEDFGTRSPTEIRITETLV